MSENPNKGKAMRIGEVAKATGISAKIIRYYESAGILPEGKRTPAGYRIYEAQDVQLLILIKRARDLGFRPTEVDQLVSFWHDPAGVSEDVKQLVRRQIQELIARIGEMQALVNTLQALTTLSQGNTDPPPDTQPSDSVPPLINP